jgi:hypothetical protein
MRAPNLLEVHARRLLGKGEDWQLHTYETLPREGNYNTPRTHFQLTGAVPSKVPFKSGPRKGQPNYKFHTDNAQVIISEADHRAFERTWELETGLCRDCGDTGQALAGYSTAAGQSFRPCTRCDRAKAEGVAP